MDKDKSRSSEKTQVLGDGSNRMVGNLSKKYIEIYNSDISENESVGAYTPCLGISAVN